MAKLSTFARVRQLEGWTATAFCAALLERMVPNYALFCEVTETSDEGVVRNGLDLLWESVRNPKGKINFAVQLERVEAITPDTRDYDGFGVYPAIDATIGLASAMSLVLGQDPQGAVVVCKLSQGSVEAFLLASDVAEEAIKDHPLMQFEIDVQNALLDIAEQGGKRNDVCDALKAMALDEGITNIGLEIDSAN